MIKHEDSPQLSPQSAANVRVTPEELAAAITALQIRKEGQPGTIAIGEAVEELGLDVTPEEVLAEIQTRRIKPKRRLDYRALWCAIACVAAPFTLFAAFSVLPQPASVGQANTSTGSSLTLSQVPEGQQVYIDTLGLEHLIDGEKPDIVQVSRASKPLNWGIIKHRGKIYVQAYTTQFSRRQLQLNVVDLYNAEDISQSEHPFIEKRLMINDVYQDTDHVTLPIDGFRYTDSEQIGQSIKITVSNIHSDGHLWDAFPDNVAR